ncbi:MAG: M10 family metallopeptidase C-terminal domain-containing protein [Proteobacteria bacterium]|nr:M10 family metallopeptidase C-terminal domain-containing protein [Pseudomonadota bacterium]
MAYTLTQLTTFFTNANAGTAPTAAQLTGLQSIANQNATGTLSDAQALQSAIDLGSDITTAVSVQSYQFFLGFAPSVAGLKALNAAYVGSGAQAGLNGENRFIAQAVSLALQNPTAKASFTAAYGSSSVADATAAAYNVIIGNAAAAAAGVNVANAVAFLSSPASVAYYEAFVKANVPGLAAADVALAVKAAIVGEIIYQATIFNNGAGLGSYATAANNLVKDLADDGALTADNASGIALFDNYGVSPVAQTLTLTAAADTLNGAAGADTFVATNTTLSAADSLTGGAGVDTLNYASNGNVAVNQAGFKASGIEVYNITSDAGAGAVGGTTFDMSGVTGATRIVNDDSSFDLTLTGLNEAATIVVRNTSQSTATVNTTVNYNAAVVAGTTTTQALVLENVFDPAQAAGTASKSAVTVNGVEIFNVTGSGSATSNLTALNSNTLTTVNIDGGQGVKIDALTFAGATGTVDGSKNTGGINVVMTNSGAINATVTGGTGADRADFSNGFATGDSFNGGAGTDTVVLSQAVATGSTGGVLTAVEVLEVSGGGTGNVNLANFASIDTVNYTSTGQANGASLQGATTITNARATLTVSQDAGTVGQTLSAALATNGAADNLTLNINKVGAADAVGAITAANWDVIKVNVADDAAVAGQGTLTSAGLTAANATSITLASDANVTFTGAVGGAALTSFDASTVTGKIDFTATTITTAVGGATIKLGSGADRLVVTNSGTATGGDTITLGAGADTVIYTALAQSTDKSTDTITDFVSGTDKLDLIGLGLTSGTQFVGVRSSFALAQGALTTAIDGVQAVFQADTNTLWVDLDSNGQLDQSDFRIILTGNSTITAGDLSLGLTGNSITLNALAANVNLTTQTGATGVTTNDNDTVTTTIANLNGAVGINAAAGTNDVLVISDAGTVSIAATVTNFEGLTLANGANTVSAAAASTIKNITGGTGNDTVTFTNFATGGAVALGAGADTLTGVSKAQIEATGASFDGGGTGIGTAAADIDTLTLANGIAAGTLDLTKASNFEVVNLGQAAGNVVVQGGATANSDGLGSGIATLNADTTNGTMVVNTTAAKLDAMTTVARTAGGNNFTINVTNAGTVNLVDTTVTNTLFTTLAANNTTFQVDTNAKAGAITANGAADVLNLTADLTAGGNVTLGGTGFETVNVTAAQTVNTLTFAATVGAVHNVSVAGAYTLGAAGTFNGTGTGNQTVTASNNATTATLAATGTNTYNGGSAADTVTVSGTATATVNGNAGADSLTVSSSGAVTFVAGADNDTLTVTGSGAVTVTGGDGVDTFTLNAATASADTIIFSDAGGVGIVAAANRDVVNNFLVANDKIQLDVTQTDAGTAAAAQPVLQVVGTAGAFTASNTADVTVVNVDLGGAVNVIGTSTDGAALINNTGAITVVANQVGYIVAYDAGNAYLYAFTNNGDTTLASTEIALIGTFNGIAVGALGAANFTLGA